MPINAKLPRVPLCRLIHNPTVRPVQDRVDQLVEEFAREGYFPARPAFYCSLDGKKMPIREVTDEDRSSWDDLWIEVNNEFERDIAGTEWSFLSNKLLYVWDGNHRLRAWMGEIKRGKCLSF